MSARCRDCPLALLHLKPLAFSLESCIENAAGEPMDAFQYLYLVA